MVLSQAFYCYQDRSRMFKGKGHTTRNRLIKKKNARGFTYFQNKNVPAIFRSTEAEVFYFYQGNKTLGIPNISSCNNGYKIANRDVFLQAYEAE